MLFSVVNQTGRAVNRNFGKTEKKKETGLENLAFLAESSLRGIGIQEKREDGTTPRVIRGGVRGALEVSIWPVVVNRTGEISEPVNTGSLSLIRTCAPGVSRRRNRPQSATT